MGYVAVRLKVVLEGNFERNLTRIRRVDVVIYQTFTIGR